MKVWKMVFLQVVTTTPAPAQWNFLHFIIASFQTLPQSLFSAGRSRDRIGEKSVGGKHVPKTMTVCLFKKKNGTYSKCKYQLLQTVTLLISSTGRSQNFALKRSPKNGFTFRGLLGNLSDLATYSHSRARNSA